jgi:hypothetical protein
MAVRPTEIKLVAKMMDPDISDEAKALAKEIIVALDTARQENDQWSIMARTMKGGPYLAIGPFSTKNQAMKGLKRVAFADDPMTTPGVGAWVGKMYQPPWLDRM